MGLEDNTVSAASEKSITYMQGKAAGLSLDTVVVGGSIQVGGGSVVDCKGKTLGDIVNEINAQGLSGVSSAIKDGKFTIASENGIQTISVSGDMARVTGMGDYIVSPGTLAEEESFFRSEVIRLSEEEALAQGYTLIKTAEDLNNIRNNITGTSSTGKYITGKYILMNDIDLSSIENWDPIGGTLYKNAFRGTFDGNGYKISNLKINRPTEQYVGLFGYTSKADIKNLALENVNITGQESVGAIAGSSDYYSKISNCYVSGTINGQTYVGGIAGQQNSGSDITDCYSTATVTADAAASYAGGIVGSNTNSGAVKKQMTVTNCSFTGEVKGHYAGGIAGATVGETIISNCFVTGSVSSSYAGGGIAGLNSPGSVISKCYTSGSITGTVVEAAIAGTNTASYGEKGTVSDCIWNTETTGQTAAANGDGIYNNNLGLTTEQMADASNWSSFDDAVWDKSTYPPKFKKPAGKGIIIGSVDTSTIEDKAFFGQNNGLITFSNNAIVSVSKTDTRSQVMTKITAAGLEAEIDSNGKIKILTTGADSLEITSDTSGFADFYGLNSVGAVYSGGIDTKAEAAGSGNTAAPSNPSVKPEFNLDGLITEGISNIRLQIGGNSASYSAIYCDTTFIFDDFSLDLTSSESASKCLKSLEALSKAVTSKISLIGTYETRLDSIAQSNVIKAENLESSYSAVIDADIAVETEKYIKYQILQQTAQALLAQAQAAHSQLVLKLINNVSM